MYIVYLVKNTVTEDFYVGYHKQKPGFGPDEFDGYLGSGLVIKRAVDKYGKDAFTRTTLFSTESKADAMRREEDLLREYLSSDKKDKMYNIIELSFGGDTQTRNPKKQIISEKRKAAWTPELRERIAASRHANGDVASPEGRQRTIDGCRKYLKERNPMKNPDSREKMKESRRGLLTGGDNPAAVKTFCIRGSIIVEYSSTRALCKELNMDIASFTTVRKKSNGALFSYKGVYFFT